MDTMPTSPATLPRSDHLVHVCAPRLDRTEPALRDVLQRLQALQQPAQWQAATLALMLTPGSRRERTAWLGEVPDVADAQCLLDDVLALPHSHRLPWFEAWTRRLATGSVAQRHALIDAARRVMSADGMVSQFDQLRWVALRHLLAGTAVAAPAAAATELDVLDDAQALKVCVYSAFLSQLVPAPELTLDLTGHDSISQAWYDAVTAAWCEGLDLPARDDSHDIDAALRALRVLQALPWLQRPLLVRGWFDAARAMTDGSTLHPVAADALRLTCVLLDSPVPPELANQYSELDLTRH